MKFLIFKYKLFPKTMLKKSKVIAVGNITAGGTGKTPFVIWLVEELKKRNFSVCVVFRAYNSKKNNGKIFDGEKFLMNIEESGDEPWIIAYNTKVPVYIGKSRASVAVLAEKEYSPDFIVLDDAFQYWRLERDIDIVCVDSSEYFYNKKILPAGIMREPIKCLNRASWVVIKNDNNKIVDEKKVTKYFNKKENISIMNYKYNSLIKKSHKLLAIAGIAKPKSFFECVKNIVNCTEFYTMEFNDHEVFDYIKIKNIKKYIKENNITEIICTEKDYYKLKDKFTNIYFLKVNAKISNEETLFEYIINSYNSGRY
ncbi:MAG: tetraacyldisaccharide 4'-kinase [Candidatus Muirbacterium halophilum]|nr:tetraacyldisaccharide 4'-kinase [Candidatus Muirbacterium halophilum]MCK9474696.1 tetraacyldisaccharide 4'-kinase [Candidatus Muirbacterium halophilum]